MNIGLDEPVVGKETKKRRDLFSPQIRLGENVVGISELLDVPVSDSLDEGKAGLTGQLLDGFLGRADVAVHELEAQRE